MQKLDKNILDRVIKRYKYSEVGMYGKMAAWLGYNG